MNLVHFHGITLCSEHRNRREIRLLIQIQCTCLYAPTGCVELRFNSSGILEFKAISSTSLWNGDPGEKGLLWMGRSPPRSLTESVSICTESALFIWPADAGVQQLTSQEGREFSLRDDALLPAARTIKIFFQCLFNYAVNSTKFPKDMEINKRLLKDTTL